MQHQTDAQLQRLVTMPPLRQFGREIDGNVRRKRNIDAETRDKIVGMLLGGALQHEAATRFNTTQAAVSRIYKKWQQTGTTKDKKRPGRPPILTPRQKKIIYRKARASPKIEYKDLIEAATVIQVDGTPSRLLAVQPYTGILRHVALSNIGAKRDQSLTAGRL